MSVARNHTTLGTERKLYSGENSYPIPSLKVINEMVAVVPDSVKALFRKAILVACQHNLETTVTIYNAMKQLGIRKIYSVGKCYSDSPEIQNAMIKEGVCLMPSGKPRKVGEFQKVCRHDIRAMWERCIEELPEDIDTIIVLDDGGRCLEEMPPYVRYNYQVAGIEQTRGGLYSPVLNQLPFPVIEVASSALKREIEPIFIVKAVINELKDRMQSISRAFNFNSRTVIGVIGNGAIGSAVAQYFAALGYIVTVYDENEEAFRSVAPKHKLFRASSREAVISNAQCIFGCTGKDALKGIPILDIIQRDTVFISCSSEDREYLETLQDISNKSIIMGDPLQDIICTSKNGSKAIFFRGGYPFNFNGKPWNVPATEIEPTQGALLGAVVQAVTCAKKPAGDGRTKNQCERLMLDPYIQQFVVRQWRITPAASQHSSELLDCFYDIEWIKENSGGKDHALDSIRQHFASRRDLHKAELSSSTPPPRSRL